MSRVKARLCSLSIGGAIALFGGACGSDRLYNGVFLGTPTENVPGGDATVLAEHYESAVARPEVLAFTPQAFGLAVDEANVYVSAQEGEVTAVPIAGGTAQPLGQKSCWKAIGVDELHLYSTDCTSLYRCEKANCAATTQTLVSNGGDIKDLALDAEFLYWASISGPPSSREGHIMKMPKNGGPQVELARTKSPQRLGIDEVNVYWVDGQFPDAGILEVPKAGGTSVPLIVFNDEPPAMTLAVGPTDVFFTLGDGKLAKISKKGGPRKVLLSNLGNTPLAIAVDAENVYSGNVERMLSVPLDGGPVRLMLRGSIWITNIITDENNVYVSDTANGAVIKVAKRPTS